MGTPEQNFIFSIGSVGLSKCGGKSPCSLANAVRHNRRAIAAEIGVSSKSKINPARCHLNQVLCGYGTVGEVTEFAEQVRLSSGVGKLKRDHVQAIELLFSLPTDSPVTDLIGYFQKCLEWTQSAIELVILSFDVHLDEPEPHAHCLISPFLGGKSHAKDVRSKANVKRLTESFFKAVAGPAGLRRQGARMAGMVKEWAVQVVFDRLQAVAAPEIHGALWPLTQAAIKSNPVPYLVALGIDPHSIRVPTKTAIALVPDDDGVVDVDGAGFESELSR